MSDSLSASSLPAPLEAVFNNPSEPDSLLPAVMAALCEVLRCDRCFLYLRNPQSAMGAITHCYRQDPKWDDLTSPGWSSEGEVATIDPLFATALRTEVPVYVDDVDTAGPEVLNAEFERQDFKHRALIHAPIYCNGQMRGILEPCVFDHPRQWTEGDRQVITQLQQRLSPIVMAYLQQIGQF